MYGGGAHITCMNEATFSRYVMNGVKKVSVKGHFFRHEDLITPGISDISYCLETRVSGWIELKFIKNKPKNLNIKFKIRHFTDHQRSWLQTRGQLIGYCFLFVKVGRTDYYLFSWEQLPYINEYKWNDLEDHALGYWKHRVNFEELLNHLGA